MAALYIREGIMRVTTLFVLAPVILFGASGSSAQEAAGLPSVSEQRVIAGDVVRLRIWREPELSGEFPVAENGTLMLPKLGAVATSGLSADSLTRQLQAAFRPLLQHGVIEVTVLRRIQVLGAVHRPGLYPVDATMTVSDVLALAGGADATGRRGRVELVPRGGGERQRLSGSQRLSSVLLESGDQIYVPERGWLDRHMGVLAAAVTASLGALITVASR